MDLASVVKQAMAELVPDYDLTDDTPVNVPHKDYFNQITKVIDEAPLEAVIDYLVFRSGIHLVNRSSINVVAVWSYTQFPR